MIGCEWKVRNSRLELILYESEEEEETVRTRGFRLTLRHGIALGLGYDWTQSNMSAETGDVQRHMLTRAPAYCDRDIDLKSILGRYPGTRR
jgi:outer membrane protease